MHFSTYPPSIIDNFYPSGETFSIDPLEISQVQTMIHEGREWTICVNTINPQVNPYGSGLDYVLGDIFMRNVYSVYVTFQFFVSGCCVTSPHPLQVQLWRHIIQL